MAETDAKLNPTAMPVADAARLLSAAGGQVVTVEMLEADIEAGAPTNPGRTLNLVHYAAWRVRQASGDGRQASGTDVVADRGSWSLGPEARSPRPGGSHAD